MKAAIFKGPGKPLSLEEVPTPRPGPGEILIRVAATGICHTDLHLFDGEIVTPPEGFVPGHEVSGWVEELGPGVENPYGLSRGDAVLVSWLIPCGRCKWCVRGQENYCPYTLSRMPGLLGLNGGHAEYLSVPEDALIPLPKGVDVYSSAPISCAYGTAYRALREVGVGPGTSCVIIGVGGVGLAAVQLAHVLGAYPIIAVDVRERALRKASELGATHLVDASTEDPIPRIREVLPDGADVVHEARPSPDLNIALEIVRRGGSIVVTGLGDPGSTISALVNHLVTNGIRIVGSLGYRPRVDLPEILSIVASGRLDVGRLISHVYSPEQINEAYENLRKGLHFRAIVKWG